MSTPAATYSRPLPTLPTSAAEPSHWVGYEEQATMESGGGGGAVEPSSTNEQVETWKGVFDGQTCCNSCKLSLEQTLDSTVVTFGKYLYHVDCRCAKCNNLVEHDTNLLLLSEGLPVCQNCSYICSVCQKSIDNSAVVTGDDSYHAECFRCCQCANRIEELIFAKTQIGIWCMACHNERVAQGRKKTEAKKAARAERKKEKEAAAAGGGGGGAGRSARSRTERDKERSERAHAVAALTASGGKALTPASPESEYDLSPSVSGRDGFESASSPPGLTTNALDTLGSAAWQHRGAAGGLTGDNGSLRRPNAATSPSPSPALSMDSGGIGGASPTFSAYMVRRESEGSALQTTSTPAGMTPSEQKQMNRRSGFYGSRPSLDEGPSTQAIEEPSVAAVVEEETHTDDEDELIVAQSEAVEEDPMDAIRAMTTKTVTPVDKIKKAFLPELHNSMSFYDSDTLLFLNHVGGSPAPRSPKNSVGNTRPTPPRGSIDETKRLPPRGPSNLPDSSEVVEHLSPDLGGAEFSSGRDVAMAGGRSVARKVRESIRLSRDGTDGKMGGALDVELVELLLNELDETKKEMQDWQAKYDLFQRASRSAFEGFSMAREEYDREIAARREVEARLDALRTKFVEQARRLAAVDQEQKTTEALKRQSHELRSSVVATERQLSALRAEVELSTAQAAELSKAEDSKDASQALIEALNARLEEVKDRHRDEITRLVEQRDELTREVEALQEARSRLVEESTTLQARNESLEGRNADASRQLESLRDQMSKVKITNSPTNGHHPSPSTASLARSPLARPSASPNPGQGEAEPAHRFAKPETVEAPTIKKFKWGKAKTVTTASIGSPQLQVADHGERKGSVMGLGVGAGAIAAMNKSPQSMRSGSVSIDSSAARPHAFQQTSILRPVRCDYCGDKMWGLNEVRCTGCGCYSHAKCAMYLQTPCSHGHAGSVGHASEDTMTLLSQSSGMFGNDLSLQVNAENREVPLVVSKCINAVEETGMWQEGIYRKTGGMGQTKRITQLFESGQEFDLEDTDQFNDPAAVTSCLKNYFRCLPDPLFTFDLHEDFVSCSEMPEGEDRLERIETTLLKLPEAHYRTARCLLRHLHRVHLQSAENKMTPANLGVVFGPTVMRSRVPEREWSDMGAKAKMIELLIEHCPRFFDEARE